LRRLPEKLPGLPSLAGKQRIVCLKGVHCIPVLVLPLGNLLRTCAGSASSEIIAYLCWFCLMNMSEHCAAVVHS